MPNPAAVAYEAYREVWNATATNNTYMVSWAHVSEAEKKAWWAVVRKLASTVISGLTDQESNEGNSRERTEAANERKVP